MVTKAGTEPGGSWEVGQQQKRYNNLTCYRFGIIRDLVPPKEEGVDYPEGCASVVPPERPSAATTLTQPTGPRPGTGLGLMPWVLPLGAGSAVTLLCLTILLAVMVYWRWVKELKKNKWVVPRP